MTRFNLRGVVLVIVLGLAVALSGNAAMAKGKKGGGGSKKPPANNNNNSSNNNTQQTQQQKPPTTSPAENEDPAIQKAQADMKAAETRVKTTFEATSEWTAAQSAVTKAQADYDSSSSPVIAALKSKQDYKDAAAKLDKAEANLAQLKEGGSATPAQISDAAAETLADRSAVRTMESDAISNDPGVSAAKTKLTAALAAVAQLHEKELAAVSADPAWQDAKKRLDDERAKLASAQK